MYCLSIEWRILDKILYVVVHSLIYNTISVIPVLVLTKLWALTGRDVLRAEYSVKISFDAVEPESLTVMLKQFTKNYLCELLDASVCDFF